MKKQIGRLFLCFFSILAGTYFCQWLSEQYFFDQLYYYKSIAHGYWVPGKQLAWENFGKRGQDLTALIEIPQQKSGSRVLGLQNDQIFTVAIIGDSFVWGQGVKERNRFPILLEQKLNTIIPTQVISLGNSGDGIIENFMKYRMISSQKSVDLYIFGFVKDDILLNSSESTAFLYGRQQDFYTLYASILTNCPGTPVSKTDINEWEKGTKDTYLHAIEQALDLRHSNMCLFDHVASFLPQEQAVYYFFEGLDTTSIILRSYNEILQSYHLQTVFPSDFYYKKFIKQESDFYVSSREDHPSKKANEMFAQQLFDVIMEKKWVEKTK